MPGGGGFLGGAVCRRLAERGPARLDVVRRRDYDLTREQDVARMYDELKPDVVINLAAEVGGIGANRDHPGRFFFANMAMGMHLIEHGRRRGVRKFVQVGTVCAYPQDTPVPFREEDIWNGYPEPTNAPYGIAKRAQFVMLDGYRREYGMRSAIVVPINLYGPGDNFDLHTSHVVPALIRKCHEAVERGASSVTCWGTGRASREFLYVDDAADGVVAAAERMDEPTPINLGTGEEVVIRDLAERIARMCGFEGTLEWDTDQPDGQQRRSLDVGRARDLLGWSAGTGLDEGLQSTVDWYRSQSELREVTYGS